MEVLYVKSKLNSREFRLWGVLAILIIIIWLIFMSIIVSSKNHSENTFLDSQLNRFEGEVQSTLLTYESFSSYIFDEIEQDQDIMEIIYKANTSSDKEKEILRDELYNKLDKKYSSMKKYGFRQLHFHLPNTESFLRVHAPDKYGDILSNVRESIYLVNKNKIKVKGFEEGKVFNGFRYVYPLEYKDIHIGSVEVSISSASIIEVLSDLYPGEDFRFIIDKSAVNKIVSNERMANYKDSPIFNNYYMDTEVVEITESYSTIIPKADKLFFRELKENYSERLKNNKSFSIIQNFEGKDYNIRFLSIKNIKKVPTAYLISISEDVSYRQFAKNMYKEIILVTLLSLVIIFSSLMLTFYQHRLKNISELDYLTQIYNRNKFYEIIKKEIKASRKYQFDSFIILLDIDFFKKVNDTYGHEWGDEVLKELTNQISKNIRSTDTFARWGGEEFVILLANIEKDLALEKAENIRKLIDESNSKELKDITISIGMSLIDHDNYDIDSSIKLADEAMYCAKENGRNQVVYK